MYRHLVVSVLISWNPVAGLAAEAPAVTNDSAAARKAADAAEKAAKGAEKTAKRAEGKADAALARLRSRSGEDECAPGSKTIYFDLGNDAFRDPESVGRSAFSRAARVGGNLSSGAWASGCFDGGTFRERPVRAGESVRLVLLNPRTDVDYSLLFASGGIQSAEKTSLVPLDRVGPVCGHGGADCDVDAAELDGILADLRADADKLVEATLRTDVVAEQAASQARACATSLGKAPECKLVAQPTPAYAPPPGAPAPAAGAAATVPDWWGPYAAARGRFAGRYTLLEDRREVLCAKWNQRATGFTERYKLGQVDRKVLDAVVAASHAWSDAAWTELTTYTDVRQLLLRLEKRGFAFRQALAAAVEASKDASSTGPAPGEAASIAWDEAESYHYYRNNLLQFCPDHDAQDATLDRSISDALFRQHRAVRILDHAYSARVFGLRSMGANTEVVVTVYAAPAAQPPKPATAGGEEGATQEKGGSSTPVPFQFTYRVFGVDRLAFSLGTAVALHRAGAANEEHPHTIVSPPPVPLLFLNWRLWETDDSLVERSGLQAGISLKDASDIIAGKDPGEVNLYFGAVLWPVKTVALSAGLVDSVTPADPGHVQLGFYLGVSADLLALYDTWTGPKRVLAQ